MMMTSTGLDVLDRDMTGGLVGDHDGQGFSGWSAAPSFNTGGQKVVTAHGSFPVGSDSGNSGQFMQNRLDGYNDGYGNTFQGVRSQDSNAGQWSTPDAYAGDVHDPMSQKPYMWNRNNPLEYEDPTGYESGACSINVNYCGVQIPSGQLKIAGRILETVYNLTAGDDVQTLKDPRASGFAKAMSVISLATWFVDAPIRGGIKAVEYAPRIAERMVDAFHMFPSSFDEHILRNGSRTLGENGYMEFKLEGSVNGHTGHYTLGGHMEHDKFVVTHRFFVEGKPPK